MRLITYTNCRAQCTIHRPRHLEAVKWHGMVVVQGQAIVIYPLCAEKIERRMQYKKIWMAAHLQERLFPKEGKRKSLFSLEHHLLFLRMG